MRNFFAAISLFTAACAAQPPAAAPCPAPPSAVVAAEDQVAGAPKVAPPPSEADVTKWSHDLLEAWDHGNVAAAEAALAAGLVHLDGATPSGREEELKDWKSGGSHVGTRTFSNEHVTARANSAVFTAKTVEHSADNESHGGNSYTGVYTLIWDREASGWKLSYWSWKLAGAGAARNMWNEVYRGGTGFNKEPNQFLQEMAHGKKPGTALDVAMGQGRNALYLARHGWNVTGVDFAADGMQMATDEATRQKLHLNAVNADIDTYDFGVAKWDLVTMIYATDNLAWIEKIKPSLKRGGFFVLEFFYKKSADGDGFAKGQLAEIFKDGFEVVHDEVVEGVPDWAHDHAMLVRFAAKKR